MPKKPIIWILVVSLFVTGCAHNPFDYGTYVITEYKPGNKPDTTVTPYEATYALFRYSRSSEPLFEGVLLPSNKIGFERDDNGNLMAIAGSKKIPIDGGDYCWYVTSEPEFHGFEGLCHETCRDGATALALALWPVGIAIQLPFFVALCPVILGEYLYDVSSTAWSGQKPQAEPQVSAKKGE
jgi:hypothetical protein